MHWITTTPAIITSITTIVLAIITWRYVRLTQEYVRLTREMLNATNKPEVIMDLKLRGSSIILNTQNIGTGYASNITFTGDMSFKLPQNQTLGDLDPFNGGVDYLGHGHKVETHICHLKEISILPNTMFNIRITYEDSTNTEYWKLYSFELSKHFYPTQLVSSPADDIVNSLEKIANNYTRDHS